MSLTQKSYMRLKRFLKVSNSWCLTKCFGLGPSSVGAIVEPTDTSSIIPSLSRLYIVHGVLHNVVKATATKERLGTILIARDDLETTLLQRCRKERVQSSVVNIPEKW